MTVAAWIRGAVSIAFGSLAAGLTAVYLGVVAGRAEAIDRIVPLLDETVRKGMHTVERVHVVSYRGSKQE